MHYIQNQTLRNKKDKDGKHASTSSKSYQICDGHAEQTALKQFTIL